MAYSVDYEDDPSINGEEILWRRITRQHLKRADGGWKVSSAAFADPSDGTAMSTLRAGLKGTEAAVFAEHPNCTLAQFSVEYARSEDQGVASTPDEAEPGPDESHASVFGKSGNRNPKKRKRFARKSMVYDRVSGSWLPPGSALTELPPELQQ